jgi:ribonucleoside-triphosphate reductase (thioredoxin)
VAVQVSCTVTFDPDSEGPQLQDALTLHQYSLKGVSFLPRARTPRAGTRTSATPYPQMPYEAISEERYRQEVARIRPLDLQNSDIDVGGSLLNGVVVHEVPDKFCDSAGCSVGPAEGSP